MKIWAMYMAGRKYKAAMHVHQPLWLYASGLATATAKTVGQKKT